MSRQTKWIKSIHLKASSRDGSCTLDRLTATSCIPSFKTKSCRMDSSEHRTVDNSYPMIAGQIGALSSRLIPVVPLLRASWQPLSCPETMAHSAGQSVCGKICPQSANTNSGTPGNTVAHAAMDSASKLDWCKLRWRMPLRS